jgi:hypothetical protein
MPGDRLREESRGETALAVRPPAVLASRVNRAVRIVAAPSPFRTERIEFGVREGTTLEEMIRRAGIPPQGDARVFIETASGLVYGPIPRAQWPCIKPKPGTRVVIRAIVSGSGGGDENKTLRILLQIVVLLVAVVLIATGYGAIAGVLLIVAFLAINMLLPPQFPKLGKLANLNNASGKAPESPTLSISGSQNQANPYGPIPRLFGRHQIFMPARQEVPA